MPDGSFGWWVKFGLGWNFTSTTGLYPESYLAFGAVGHDDIDKHEHKAVIKFLHRLDGTLLQALLYRVDIARPKNDFVDHTIVDNQFSERLVICHLR